MTSRWITPGQEKILRYFVDERLYRHGGKGQELHLKFEDILEAKWPRIVAGYIPNDMGNMFKLDYQALSDGWRKNIAQGLIERTQRQNQYKLSSIGEDYVLEVLWKYE